MLRQARLRPRARWGVLLLLIATVGCAGGGWVKDRPEVAARARADPGGFVAPALEQLGVLQGLRSNYAMRVTRGIGGRSFDLYVSAQRGGMIDILVQAPTGITEAYLRANEREVGMFVREDMVLYSGPAGRDAFARALGFGLSAQDAVAALLGYGVERDSLPAGVAAWDAKLRRVRIDHGSEVSAWLHPLTLRFDRVEHRAGQGLVIVQVQEWRAVLLGEEFVSIPARLSLEVDPDGYGISLRLVGEPEINPRYDAGYFELQRPPSVLELPLSDLARDGGLFRRTAVQEPGQAGDGVR